MGERSERGPTAPPAPIGVGRSPTEGAVGWQRVEVVDEDGAVVDTVTRAEMRAGNLRHRSVGIVVRRPADQAVLVHRRAAWKDVWPGRWDIAFGGVCDVGETDVAAARRELAEEAGIDVEPSALRLLGTGTYEDESVRAVGTIFEVDHDGPFTFTDGEVEATDWVPWDGLGRWLADHRHCPDTVHILRKLGKLLRTLRPWPDAP